MAFVRYVALAALVVWLAALGGTLAGDALGHVRAVSAACGGIVVLALVAMKFIGPPPRAFAARTAIALAMLAAMGATVVWRAAAPIAIPAAAALGFVLLAWYAHEP